MKWKQFCSLHKFGTDRNSYFSISLNGFFSSNSFRFVKVSGSGTQNREQTSEETRIFPVCTHLLFTFSMNSIEFFYKYSPQLVYFRISLLIIWLCDVLVLKKLKQWAAYFKVWSCWIRNMQLSSVLAIVFQANKNRENTMDTENSFNHIS